MSDTRLIAFARGLARARVDAALARQRVTAASVFIEEAHHHLYAGDTALHVAAVAYRAEAVRALVGLSADVRAANRRGAEPIHYAADGDPDLSTWDPDAQAATIAALLESGADPNALDASGVAPLHRAVRTRCTGAVRALLEGGARSTLPNGRGSLPMALAERTTGRGGAGSPAAKREQERIIALLRAHGG